MKRPACNDGHAGMTLTELMVAFSVVAVLMVLVITGARHVGAIGERSRCVANLRQAAAGLIAYTTENRGAFPYANRWYNRGDDPSAPGMREYMNVSSNTEETRTRTSWTCPALQRDPNTKVAASTAFNRTYTLNACATIGVNRYSLDNIFKVPHPARMITFFDGSIQTRERNANVYHISHGYRHYPERFTAPHNDRLNVAFLDGHVESLTVVELLEPEGLESRWEGK